MGNRKHLLIFACVKHDRRVTSKKHSKEHEEKIPIINYAHTEIST